MQNFVIILVSLMPILAVFGITLLIAEGIVPWVLKWWHSNDHKRKIAMQIARSRNY